MRPLLGRGEDAAVHAVPRFVARPSLGGEFAASYRDDDVGVLVLWAPARRGTSGLPQDGPTGAGYVEQRLARLLAERP